MEGDLRVLSRFNIIFKYADDTNLLVPEHTDIDLATEFQNILNWTKNNRMMVNISKTKKLVFHRLSAKAPLPCPLTDIEQVVTAKLLGVTFSQSLSFESHVSNILTICSQRMYLLKCLKSQGLPAKQLHIIFCAIIVSRILYALPAWGGYLPASLVSRINAFLPGASNHCLHQLLPPIKSIPTQLRDSQCLYELPVCHYNLYKCSFVLRNLFLSAY